MSFAGLLPCFRAICGTHKHKSNLLKEDDLLLSKKSGFCLSSERAVMMVVFSPVTSWNFSCAVVESEAGDWQTVHGPAGSSSFPASALHQ